MRKENNESFEVYDIVKPIEITFKTNSEPILKTMDCFD